MKQSLAPFFLVVAAFPAMARAQPEPEAPTVIALHPAGEPTPALKYTLLPEPRDLLPGNAAIFYHRAIQLLLETQSAQERQARSEGRATAGGPEGDVSDWISGPIDRIPRDEAKAQLGLYSHVLREVELGARRRECDWEFDDRPESIALLIPEVQSTRSLARLISLRVRLAILDGDTDAAVHWLQAGYALARHVSNGPTIIQALVGIAITSVMSNDLIELIQGEGTPCLYWAIARLPSPMIDLSPGLEGERSLLDRMVPDFREIDGIPWSPERGRLFLDRLAEQIAGFTDGLPSDPWGTKLGLTAIVARTYPEAKRTLIASGRDKAEVEAMPAIQVVGIVAIRQFRALSDDQYKWMSLPYLQSYQGFVEQERRTFHRYTPGDRLSNPGLALFGVIQPALNALRLAQVRIDRQLDSLRCVEAIRLHAASHDGRLPASLDDITEAPIPPDPGTGKPFSYTVDADGTTATFSAPLFPGAPEHPSYRISYELRLED